MVHDLVARPQLPDIDLFRDELSQGDGETVCSKYYENKRAVD
jgi:hypothetical protein